MNSEKVFDMLPYVAEIFEKIDIINYINKSKGKEKDQEKAGMQMIIYIVKNSAKVKEEFFNVVAIAEEKTVEEVKKQGLASTIKTFKEIFSDPELMDFFKQAIQ
jgi:2,4-dienoyl-CoA reductase-like NADH-dependent reductase (Old Yellow Enzyme family)